MVLTRGDHRPACSLCPAGLGRSAARSPMQVRTCLALAHCRRLALVPPVRSLHGRWWCRVPSCRHRGRSGGGGRCARFTAPVRPARVCRPGGRLPRPFLSAGRRNDASVRACRRGWRRRLAPRHALLGGLLDGHPAARLLVPFVSTHELDGLGLDLSTRQRGQLARSAGHRHPVA